MAKFKYIFTGGIEMTNRIADISPRKTAIIVGVLFLKRKKFLFFNIIGIILLDIRKY